VELTVVDLERGVAVEASDLKRRFDVSSHII